MGKTFTEEQNRQWQASLPKKKIAVKVIVKSDKGNVLLVKPDYKKTWQLPGGGVEANEDPKLAAVRESKEETNLDIDTNDLKIIDTVFKPDEDYLFLIYEYQKAVDENAGYEVEDEEIETYAFVPLQEVAKSLPPYYRESWNKYSS